MSKAAPWEDYASPAAPAAAGGGMPWEDYAKPERRKLDRNSAEYKLKELQDRAEMEKLADPTAGMWGITKAAANIGAGAHGIYQGLKQRAGEIGIGPGVSADDVRETRRIDEQLADKTAGGHVLQGAGAALPLIAAGMIPGMQGIVGGAALGALGGAAQATTEDESALMNTALGAGIGGAVPAVLKGSGALWRKFGPGAANRAAAAAVTEAAGADAAQAAAAAGQPLPEVGGRLARPTGQSAAQAERQRAARAVADQLRGVQPVNVAGEAIPMSAGAALDNAGLTRLEAGSRNRNAANWTGFRQTQAERIANALRGTTSAADELAERTAARGAQWEADAAEAMAHADPAQMAEQTSRLYGRLGELQQTPAMMRQGIPELYGGVEGRLGSVRELTPEHLAELRTGLNKGFSSPTGNVGSKDVALMGLKQEFDDSLNAITGDRWQNVPRNFSQASRGVEESEAAQAIRDAFFDRSGRALGVAEDAAGNIPKITENKLSKLIEKQARPDRFGGGSTLAPQAEQDLQSLLRAVRGNENVQRFNRAATGGGGSATESNRWATAALGKTMQLMRGALEHAVPGGRVAGAGIDAALASGASAREAAMARALQDPELMARLLDQYARSQTPSAAAQMVVNAIRSGGVAGT